MPHGSMTNSTSHKANSTQHQSFKISQNSVGYGKSRQMFALFTVLNDNKDASKAESRSFRYEGYSKVSRCSEGYSKVDRKLVVASRWQVSLAIPQGGILDLARLLNVNRSEDVTM
ncbi:hypothetical protein BCON_0015g00720 [Botryotinia convoluta]|uniref:Uncharacterized protein n=1 Tax=Botryotinia convoluta TaxID=54673 RepID=A0A4Z1J1Z2_9HELO|nr:hypothetical protein BCON_0015g00720 [Botryotinia convoluta]